MLESIISAVENRFITPNVHVVSNQFESGVKHTPCTALSCFWNDLEKKGKRKKEKIITMVLLRLLYQEKLFTITNSNVRRSCLIKVRWIKSQRQICPLSPAVTSNVESCENLQVLIDSPLTCTIVCIFVPVFNIKFKKIFNRCQVKWSWKFIIQIEIFFVESEKKEKARF